MYTNKKLERKKLDRLKKYKEFLQSDYGGGYWAGDLYSIIDNAILTNSLPKGREKLLNAVETEYQKYLQNK